MKPNNIQSIVLIAGLATISNVLANEFPASGDFAKGAQVWADNCGRCHNIRGSQDMRNDQWITTMFHMRVRAGLTGQETRDVLTFLQTSNSPALVVSEPDSTVNYEEPKITSSKPEIVTAPLVKNKVAPKPQAITRRVTKSAVTNKPKPNKVRTRPTRPAPVIKPTSKVSRAVSSSPQATSKRLSPTELALANKVTTAKSVVNKKNTKSRTIKSKAKTLKETKTSKIKSVTNKLSGKSGKAIYSKTCIACHGSDGTGALPGVPDFTKKGGRLEKSDAILINNIINGFQSPGSPMAMPAKGGNPKLTEADIRAVLAYIRSAFSK